MRPSLAGRTSSSWSYSVGLVLCILGGLTLAIVFSAVAMVLYLVNGSDAEVSVGALLLLYFGGFLSAGMIAGLLNPIGRTALGAVALGVIAFVPISMGTHFLVKGEFLPLEQDAFVATVMTAIFLGGSIGFCFWREFTT